MFVCVYVLEGSVKKKNYSGGDKARDRSQRACSDTQLKEIQASQALAQPPLGHTHSLTLTNTEKLDEKMS